MGTKQDTGWEKKYRKSGKNMGNLLIPVKLVVRQAGGLAHIPGKEAVKENGPASTWRGM